MGFTPIYFTEKDYTKAVEALEGIINTEGKGISEPMAMVSFCEKALRDLFILQDAMRIYNSLRNSGYTTLSSYNNAVEHLQSLRIDHNCTCREVSRCLAVMLKDVFYFQARYVERMCEDISYSSL